MVLSIFSQSRGQIFEPDFMASLVIFGLVIGFFLTPWNTIMSSQTRFAAENDMRQQAERTAAFMVATPGYPEDWESSNATIVGFAEQENLLDAEKLDAFNNMSYARQKDLLRARDFYLEIANETGPLTVYGNDTVYGKSYENASTVIPVKRDVLVNVSGKIRSAKFTYVVWDDEN